MGVSSCPSGKICYATAKECYDALRKMRRRGRRMDLAVFKCTFCSGFHCGRSSRKYLMRRGKG